MQIKVLINMVIKVIENVNHNVKLDGYHKIHPDYVLNIVQEINSQMYIREDV